jgi:outer membrane receptor for ferrienterochelin and colicin
MMKLYPIALPLASCRRGDVGAVLWLALGLWLLVYPVARADDALVSKPASSTLQELEAMSPEELLGVQVASVATASKRLEKTTAAPGTVLVITKEDILLRGYSNLKDVLRDLPGMETTEYYFSEFGTQVAVRGITGNNKIAVLVNGMRVNPPGGENFPFRNDFSVRQAERIEVIYGPGSTLYGQDAISAVINVVTAQPDKSFTGNAGVDGGFYDTVEGWAAVGGAFGADKQFKASAYVQVLDSELTSLDKHYPSWWKPYETVAKANGSGSPPDRTDYGLNALMRLETESSSIQVWHRESERSSSEGFTTEPPSLGYVPEARWRDRSTVIEGRNRLTFTDAVYLDSAVTYNRYEISPHSRYVFPASSTNWFFDDYKYGIGDSIGLEETVHATLTPKLELVGGASVAWSDIIPKSTVPGGADPDEDVVSQGGSFVYIDGTGTTNSIQRVVQDKYETYAVYAELAWQAAEKLKLIGGARLTYDTRFDELPFTPRAALVYDVNTHVTAKYIFTRAYVQPAAYFGFATYDNGTLLNTSNPDLEPESAISHEINVSYHKENMSLGLSVYYGQQENLIQLSDRGLPQNVVEDPVTMLDGSTRTLVKTVNGGDSHNVGLDLFGQMKCGRVNTWMSYSFVDFEEETGSMTAGLRGISAHNGRFGLTWMITPKLLITPSLVIRSRPEHVLPGALDDELDIPWEVNLHALYRLHRHVDVFFTLRNVFDHEYALGGVTGFAVPQETFTGVLGVRATF